MLAPTRLNRFNDSSIFPIRGQMVGLNTLVTLSETYVLDSTPSPPALPERTQRIMHNIVPAESNDRPTLER